MVMTAHRIHTNSRPADYRSGPYVPMDAQALQYAWDEQGRTIEAGRHTILSRDNDRRGACQPPQGFTVKSHLTGGTGIRARWRAAWIKPAELLRSMPSSELAAGAVFVLAFPAIILAFALVTP